MDLSSLAYATKLLTLPVFKLRLWFATVAPGGTLLQESTAAGLRRPLSLNDYLSVTVRGSA